VLLIKTRNAEIQPWKSAKNEFTLLDREVKRILLYQGNPLFKYQIQFHKKVLSFEMQMREFFLEIT